MRPRIFIASSIESLDIAHAIQSCLANRAEVSVWDQDVFRLSRTTLDSLTKALHGVDFAVFVFAPDDVVRIRGAELASVRDNVLYELGVFSGWLGYRRCFIVRSAPFKKFRLPSDLLGISTATYEAKREDGNLRAAVGPACDQIQEAVRELGRFSPDDAILDEDPVLRAIPAQVLTRDIAGLWLSRFTYSAFRRGTMVTGVQFDIELLNAQGKRSLVGKNLLVANVDGKIYLHELRILIAGVHLLGRWFNTNSQNYGAFQLQIHNHRHLMTGFHFGNANDNSVQSGEWQWLKLDVSGQTIPEVVERLKVAQLHPFRHLEKRFRQWMKEETELPLREIFGNRKE